MRKRSQRYHLEPDAGKVICTFQGALFWRMQNHRHWHETF